MTHTQVADATATNGWGQSVITVACSCGTEVRVMDDTSSETYQLAVATITRHIQEGNAA